SEVVVQWQAARDVRQPELAAPVSTALSIVLTAPPASVRPASDTPPAVSTPHVQPYWSLQEVCVGQALQATGVPVHVAFSWQPSCCVQAMTIEEQGVSVPAQRTVARRRPHAPVRRSP